MAWNSQGGGPWGSGNSPQPPDIEELLKRSQDKMKRFLLGNGGAKPLVLLLIAVIGFWAVSGTYRVEPGQQGVELLFGKYVKRTPPGLHIWFPVPIGEVIKPNVERTNTLNIGFRGTGDITRGTARDFPLESLMLTSDQNIIDIDFVVQWRIKNAAEFLFNIRDPELTIKLAAESSMREIIGHTPLEDALTVRRQSVQQETKDLLQKILDEHILAGLTEDNASEGITAGVVALDLLVRQKITSNGPALD